MMKIKRQGKGTDADDAVAVEAVGTAARVVANRVRASRKR